jgi:hypothetical protein
MLIMLIYWIELYILTTKETLLVGGKKICLEVNADKSMYEYMVMSQDQNAGRSHNMKTDNSSLQLLGNNIS